MLCQSSPVFVTCISALIRVPTPLYLSLKEYVIKSCDGLSITALIQGKLGASSFIDRINLSFRRVANHAKDSRLGKVLRFGRAHA